MLPLQFSRAWRAAGIVLILGVLAGCLMPTTAFDGIPIRWSDKFEHCFSYFVLTFWFTGIYPRTRYVLIAGGLLVMGIIIEFLQGTDLIGRDLDLSDVVANSTGIALGLFLAWFCTGGWAERVEARFLKASQS